VTEDEARERIAEAFGARAVERLERFAALLTAETARQNLVAPSTLSQLWSRHLLDSAQLLALAPDADGVWLDVGSGGGLPGLVVALLRPAPIVLCEPRRLRAAFLAQAAAALDLPQVRVEQRKVEALRLDAAVISARAVAPLPALLDAAAPCAGETTLWLLPRGKSGQAELDGLPRRRRMFHVEHSWVDPQSAIVVGRGRP
jgi:16S rRNA (guanine527-N7)-methyltransferase